MARFDVYARRGQTGFLVDCQADVLSRLTTRFVVPLLPLAQAPPLIAGLNPVFHVADEEVVLLPQNAATVLLKELVRPVTSFERHGYVISNAIDMLLIGY